VEPSYDLVVIGGGSAGLLIGKYGPLLGARIAVVERARLGGDCTWFGCVPSKALLASANVAAQAARAEEFGLPPLDAREPVDLGRVMDRVAAIQQRIYDTEDAPDIVRAAGSDVIEGHAEFVSPHELRVGNATVRSRYYCIATGSTPVTPPIPGLDVVPHYTNENVFTELREPPGRLLVVGAGPVGLELGQALARLGSRVTIVDVASQILPAEDPELASALAGALASEGIELLTSTRVARFALEGGRRCAYLEHDGVEERRELDAVLVAVGKRPTVQGLGLDAAGVDHDPATGIAVDRRLRTSNPRVYGSGDVIGGHQFTHTAAHEAGIVLMNALTPIKRKADYRLVPRVVFTEPELAAVGMSEAAARAAHGDVVRAYRHPFDRVDRAVADGVGVGFAKIVTGKKDRILGAQIVGPAAGELIHEYALAIERGVDAVTLGHAVHAYPTLANGPQLAAGEAFPPRLRRPLQRIVLGLYLRLSRLRS
jgi:pyruvate/2-oxoglutarate dehydrogenase complex dihydrolipoamide dehydrogenase (E3) component